MASNIDDVVLVTVTKTSVSVTRAGFGTTLWVGQIDVSLQAERFKVYSSLAELTSAGFPTTHNAYLWANTHLQAIPARPSTFALGRRIPGVSENEEFEITAVDTGIWSGDINGTAFSFTATAADTDATTSAGIAAAIANLSEPVTSIQQPATPEKFDVAGRVGGVAFTFTLVAPGTATYSNVNTAPTAAEVWATAYTAIKTGNLTNYYILDIEDRDKTLVLEAAATLGADEKVGVFQSSDADFRANTAGNVALTIQALSNRRALVFYASDDFNLVAAGMSGFASAIRLDDASGVATWNLVILPNVLPEALETADKTNIKAAGGSYFVEIGGNNVTQTQSCEGEFMRVQTTIDWTKSRMAEDIFGLLVSTTTKIDLDAEGIGSVEGKGLGRMQRGVTNGHFNKDTKPTSDFPAPEDIEPADLNAGILRNGKFFAKFAQAIRQVFIAVELEV